jgi:predicted nuclease of restriction endonuclease-like (RecB) superfamily
MPRKPKNSLPVSAAQRRTGEIEHSPSVDLEQLIAALGGLIEGACNKALAAVNAEMVELHWQLGRHIVEFEQGGAARAAYGVSLMDTLADRLTTAYGRGYTARNLRSFRQFFLIFPIWKSVISKLSWTHVHHILRVENQLAREFYLRQAELEKWSSRELERQINSMLFERIAVSKDQAGVLAMAKDGHRPEQPADLLKDPFVFDFLGIPVGHKVSETELETRLINKLEEFLLELGRGFCFVARQKRITVGADHFYIDLVFYHRILKCFVLIDLKMAPFKPADAGQMNFYLNWFKHEENAPDDNKPIGILLCLDSNELYVKYATEGIENLVLAGRFALQLPEPKQLRAALATTLKSEA